MTAVGQGYRSVNCYGTIYYITLFLFSKHDLPFSLAVELLMDNGECHLSLSILTHNDG